MPCRIEIKEKLNEKISDASDSGFNKSLIGAKEIANKINKAYGYIVVKFSKNYSDFIERDINIPEDLITEYYNEELIIEKRMAAKAQIEDAARAGEEFDSDYLLQKGGMATSQASEEVLAKVKAVAKKMGVDIQELVKYAKATGLDTTNVNGVADLMRGIIAIATGKEASALTEEMVHIATAILNQTNPQLVTSMISKIDRFKIYKTTLDAYKDDKRYQLPNGKPDIRKIKKEAVDKLIAEIIINNGQDVDQFPELRQEENMSTIRQWWNTILDVIRGLYSASNIDVFNAVSDKIINGEIGNIFDIDANGEVFLQKGNNNAVDKMYDTISKNDSRLKLEDTDPNDRHYILDKVIRVAKSITQKIKAGKTIKEFTPLQQIENEQKRAWGSEGHRYIEQYILKNLIDEDGFKRKNFLTNVIDTTIDEPFAEQLRTFSQDLINSYKEGTRFLIEKKVINEKEKGLLASTADFIAIEPNGDEDMKVDILDWKFTSLDKGTNEDIPFYKQKDWVPQMGEYTKILYQYGLKSSQLRKARMVPFIVNYQNIIPGDYKAGKYASSLEVGNLDSTKETKLYLLPVPIPGEKTGKAGVDKLVESLRHQWEKMYVKPVSAENKVTKDIEMNQLSKAIRMLHVALNFDPLVNVGQTFINGLDKSLSSFKNLDYSKLSKQEVNTKLGELIDFVNTAKKFENIDQVFLSTYNTEDLDPDQKKILAGLERISKDINRLLPQISELRNDFILEFAVREGFTTDLNKEIILDPEKEINGLAKNFLEGTKLSSRIIRLASNFILLSKSETDLNYVDEMAKYEKVLIPLEKEARAKGVSAFSMIGQVKDNTLKLIYKLDKAFIDEMKDKRDAKDKKFFMDNMNMEEYNRLAKQSMDNQIDYISSVQWSSDDETNENIKNYRIQKIKDSLDINSKTFDGFNDYNFNNFFKQTLLEEKHYSAEYKKMAQSKAALDMWKFYTALNNRAVDMGYTNRRGEAFFPLIEASVLEKFSQTKDVFEESKDFFADLATAREEEGVRYSKTDPETNELRTTIPTYFTRNNKSVEKLTKDLNKVGALYIKALLDYENQVNSENVLLTLHAVEQLKPTYVVDDKNELVPEGDNFKTTTQSNKNAELLRTIIYDFLYGRSEDLSSIGNATLSNVVNKSSGDEATKAQRVVSTKKLIDNSNILIRWLGLGLKPLLGAANWSGGQFQMFIKSGGVYGFWQFEKNQAAIFSGKVSTTKRGLLDLISPLTDDISVEKRRELAKKYSYKNYISTWSFSDVLMSTNSFPERMLEYANAMSFIDNAIVVDGKIVNALQYLRKQDSSTKYKMSESERKALEKTFDNRVKALLAERSLEKISTVTDEKTIIPGVSNAELARFRVTIGEYQRTLNGKMNEANKANYRRDTIFRSFMMFRGWIPKMVSERTSDIQKNEQLGEWEYGRARLFVKTWAELGFRNILKIRQITGGTEEGIRLMNQVLEAKRESYYQKTGQVLEITEEEFYDLMRKELSNEMKELGLLLSLMIILLTAKAAAPPEDATALERNRYNYFVRGLNKIVDEVSFYYNPLSFESATKGNIIPSFGLMVKVEKIIEHILRESIGYAMDDQEMIDKAHPLKYSLNVVPVGNQFQNEWLPFFFPDLAKKQGIRVTSEARQ